ncbi:MAG: ClcB-like voltage-gated chloride channel protein [Verrucomicrobia bacterium]|jgi:CIC family chloride channel protein|nr:ClcB-like voltage-gated chloride channel protein [Verrucomicrobiota bacterium]
MEWWADNRLFSRAGNVLRRNWQRALRLREQFDLTEEGFHLVLAGLVGVVGGLVNLVLYHAIESTKYLLLHRPGDPVEIAESLALWQRLVVPAAGGLGAGLVLYWGLRLVGRQGSTNLLEVVVAGDGRLPLRTSLVKTVSSVLSIASGASIGREGAITALSATLASKLGQVAKWPPYRLRLLVGCGAASGIAAAYNAPIAGAVFAASIVLGHFSMNQFAPLVVSSVVATVVSRGFFGINPWYEVPPYDFTRVGQLAWFMVLGALCGGVGALFQEGLRWSERRFKALSLPVYVQLALGGLIVGIIAIRYPEVCGNGYAVTNRILNEEFAAQGLAVLFLVLLVLAKLVATSAAIGSGAVGGLMTPTLFLGAGTGAAFGLALERLGWISELPVGLFAAVGMGSLLAATTRSPLLAMIFLFEISLNYALMPALMLGCVMATLAARQFHPESVYSEALHERGLAGAAELADQGAVSDQTVGDLMQAPVPPVRDTAPLHEVASRFLSVANNFLPVVDAGGRLMGVVALHDLKEHLSSGQELQGIIAYDVMRPPPPCLTPHQRLVDVLPVALGSELRSIPVVNSPGENKLIGSVPRAEILGILSEAMDQRSKPVKV